MDFKTSVGSGVIVQLRVFRGPTQVNFFPTLPGGAHTLTFRTPKVEQPLDLRVVLNTGNECGNAEQTITVVVAQQPNLLITQVEVTQAIQRLNNTVRLAAHRRTMVRVYMSTELSDFSYTAATRALPGVTGSVTLLRAGQPIATVPPTVATPKTVQTVFFPYARESLDSSLNFVLPSEHLSGAADLTSTGVGAGAAARGGVFHHQLLRPAERGGELRAGTRHQPGQDPDRRRLAGLTDAERR